jgi:RNA polymerase sigma factor (sigma-70 family)
VTPSAPAKVAVWTAAISVSAVNPHAALIALSAAVAKEVFDLVHARINRTSVLAYLRTARAETSLRIGPSSAGPSLVLSNTSPGPSRAAGGEEGAAVVPTDDGFLPVGSGPASDGVDSGAAPDVFCVTHRQDLLAYARTRTRSWPDAEDAVSHVVEKIYEHYAQYRTLCPEGRDPIGWSKTIIRNYVTDLWRRRETQRKRSGAFASLGEDISEEITDRVIAGEALAFVETLDDIDHMIAVMAWIDDLTPKQIANQLGWKDHKVRKSLHKTRKKLRAHFGVSEARTISQKEAK